MDRVDGNLIRQLVSVEKYTYAQGSDYLKILEDSQNVPSEDIVKRIKYLPELIQMKLTEWLQMQSDRLTYV